MAVYDWLIAWRETKRESRSGADPADLSQLDRVASQTLLLADHQERIATHRQLLRRESEIEHLKLLRQLRQMQFGRKSEKMERQIEQLELRLEDLQQRQVAEPTTHCAEMLFMFEGRPEAFGNTGPLRGFPGVAGASPGAQQAALQIWR